MREIPIKLLLPEFIYQTAVNVVLMYRRLRYGEAFRKIPLTKGLYAIVSPEDYDRLSKYKWHAARHGRSVYAQHGTGSAKSGRRRGYLVMMHREVMGVRDGRLVDHRNHNGLDNRRSNLRIATWEENCWNKRKPITESSSKYKGVMWDKRRGKWQAQIGYNNRKIFIGYFDSEEKAARAYDAKAKALFSQYAATNFVSSETGDSADWTYKICYGGFTG